MRAKLASDADADEPQIEVSECYDVRVVELAWLSSRMLWIWGGEKLAPNPRRREGLVAASYRCERHYLMAMRLLGLRSMRGAAAELERAYEIENQFLTFLGAA
ncbi:MAG TPA: hypothetical protein VFQ61_27110 [Polyangiaceae bacterium]|nr:hypothetical protein [Polyangiaceae bacterium]